MTHLHPQPLPSIAGTTDLTLRHQPRRAASGWHQLQSVLATALIVAALVLTAGLVGGTVASLTAGTGPTARDAVTLVAVLIAAILVAHLARQSRPLRPVPLLPTVIQGWFRRVVELSLFGTGLTRSWTTTDPTLGLDRLVLPQEDPGSTTSDAGATPDETGDAAETERLVAAGGWARGTGDGGFRVRPRPGTEYRSSTRTHNGPSVAELRAGPTLVHTVARGDTWWSLADRYLGNGRHWSALVELNHGRATAPGQILHDASPLRRGWEIVVPKRDLNE